MKKNMDFQNIFVNFPSSPPSSSSSPKKVEMLHLFIQSTRPVQLVSFKDGEEITPEVEIKPFFPSNQVNRAFFVLFLFRFCFVFVFVFVFVLFCFVLF